MGLMESAAGRHQKKSTAVNVDGTFLCQHQHIALKKKCYLSMSTFKKLKAFLFFKILPLLGTFGIESGISPIPLYLLSEELEFFPRNVKVKEFI